MDGSQIRRRPVRLLSIDGGGVRGLSSLVLLEQIMEMANEKRKGQGLEGQQPWQMFDLIGGTSTGGLIAIMLGRLQMSINDARHAYMRLSGEAFTEKNFVGRIKGKVMVGPRFQTESLERAIQDIIGEGWEERLLKDERNEHSVCRTFVVTHLQDGNTVSVLRSYRNFKQPRATFDEMLIWQAARATSAALTYFEPIEISGSTYSDGGLLYNNPVFLVHAEASEIFQEKEQIIVSLGTGLGLTTTWNPSLTTVAQDLADLATQTERTAADFYRRDGSKAAKDGKYFRFNVPELGTKGLAESEPADLRDIRRMTETYLDDPEVGSKIESCSERLAEGLAVTVPSRDPETLRNIWEWLSNLNFAKFHAQCIDEKAGDTGSWIETEFQGWLTGSCDLLWLRGIPGAGKTMVIASLIDYLKVESRPNSAIGFIYFRRDIKHWTVKDLAASLLRQILQSRGNMPSAIEQMYQLRRMQDAEPTKPSYHEYESLLLTETSTLENIFLLIDALDEGPEQVVFQLLGLISKWQRLNTNVRVLVSSRQVDTFRQALEDAKEIEHWAKDEDVDSFVSHAIMEHYPGTMMFRMVADDTEFKKEISHTIIGKSHGMFLMANLLVKALGVSKARTKKAFRTCLHDLPSIPDQLYRSMWDTILQQDAEDIALAKKVFSWVSYVVEPLQTDALQHALCMSEQSGLMEITADDIIVEDKLLSVCQGLIVAKHKTGLVEFVHDTAKQFFPGFLMAQLEQQAHNMIGTVCLQYVGLIARLEITEDLPRSRSSISTYPLSSYACRYWGFHAKKLAAAEMCDRVIPFLDHNSTLKLAAYGLLARLSDQVTTPDPNLPSPDGVSGLHLAAYFGLHAVVARILDRYDGSIDEAGPEGWDATRWAAFGQQAEIVHFLVWKGADLETVRGDGRTTLLWALGESRTVTFRNLHIWNCAIEMIRPNKVESLWDTDFRSGLAMRTSKSILRFLVQNTRDANVTDSRGRTALSIAAELGQCDIVEQLLDQGANIAITDQAGMTALLWALQFPTIQREYKDIQIWGTACVLLGQRTYIKNTGTPAKEPYVNRIAAHYDQKTVSRLICSNLEAVDCTGRTALSLAAEKGLEVIAQNLIAEGADPDSIDPNGRTPLIWSLMTPVSQRYIVDNIQVWGQSEVLIGNLIQHHGDIDISPDPLESHDIPDSKEAIATILASRSKNLGHKDKQGFSVIDVAIGRGIIHTPELTKLLAGISGHELPQIKGPDRQRQYHRTAVKIDGFDTRDHSRSWIGTFYPWENVVTPLTIEIICRNVSIWGESDLHIGELGNLVPDTGLSEDHGFSEWMKGVVNRTSLKDRDIRFGSSNRSIHIWGVK